MADSNTDNHDRIRRERRAEAQRRLRAHREHVLGYNPTDTPSLSARRALARMFASGKYTTAQVAGLTQSDQPTQVIRQLQARKYIRSAGIGTEKRWSLTAEGLRRADSLRAGGFSDFLPPKTPPPGAGSWYEKPARPSTKGTKKPVLSRTAVRLFDAGAPAAKYLTPPQQRLLVAVASLPGGLCEDKPNQRTADTLVRFGLATRTPEGFLITETGNVAAKELTG
jgi:hypothetical protein